MKLNIYRTRRIERISVWAVITAGIWGIFTAVLIAISKYKNTPIDTCLFKNITHVPCPTCGATRGCLRILHGNIIQGFLYNPLLFIFLSVFTAVLIMKVVFGYAIRLKMNTREKIVIWTMITLLFILNWAYIILYVG